MSKKINIFVSHIAEEAELASIFLRHLEKGFGTQVDVFVSSKSGTIALGEQYFRDHIEPNLKKADLLLALCSSYSVARPWINFEVGTTWFRGIPSIIVCHSGMTPARAGMPLTLLQGIVASDESALEILYSEVCKSLNLNDSPTVNFKEWSREIKAFELDYTVNSRIESALKGLHEIDQRVWSQIVDASSTAPREITVEKLLQIPLEKMRPLMDELAMLKVLTYSVGKDAFIDPNGTAKNVSIFVDKDLRPYVNRG